MIWAKIGLIRDKLNDFLFFYFNKKLYRVELLLRLDLHVDWITTDHGLKIPLVNWVEISIRVHIRCEKGQIEPLQVTSVRSDWPRIVKGAGPGRAWTTPDICGVGLIKMGQDPQKACNYLAPTRLGHGPQLYQEEIQFIIFPTLSSSIEFLTPTLVWIGP